MQAIHVNSSAPFFSRGGNRDDYQIDLFELYNTIISALMWRKKNGRIKLIADTTVYNYYKSLGMLSVWDETECSLSDDLEGINPSMFWAAGKLLALRDISAPVVMLDTDFIVWKELEFGDNIITAHRENLSPEIYPDISHFKMKNDYIYNEYINKETLPCNTAFLYLPDEGFKMYYTNMAIDFMKSSCDNDDYLCYMVYAEQRLLAICADYLKMKVETLLDKDKLFVPQDFYTHLWGAKGQLRKDALQRYEYYQRCKARLRKDFPEYEFIIKKLEKLEN